ncbi:hypothetical protein BDV39DRAFT_176045 [Aspergillus sergii]|uniref:Uncharacterized protein n=1 Tax=Aspergillus sergii TaxID=1034303 RepID=A0A5N6X3R7_9EURO|nr:hypothetical protein BDV39DRAFT_176045 [Aspergillus sergii]
MTRKLSSGSVAIQIASTTCSTELIPPTQSKCKRYYELDSSLEYATLAAGTSWRKRKPQIRSGSRRSSAVDNLGG